MKRSVAKLTSTLKRDAIVLWTTLTYPDDYQRYPERGFPTDTATCKRHLLRVKKCVERVAPEVSAIYRLQGQQQRGAPHYHIAIYVAEENLEAARAAINRSWARQLGLKELPYGCVDMRVVSEPSEVAARLGYLGKLDRHQDLQEFIEHSGSLWGAWSRKKLPVGRCVEVPIYDEQTFIRIRRPLLRHRRKTTRRGRGRETWNPDTVNNLHGGAAVAAQLATYHGLGESAAATVPRCHAEQIRPLSAGIEWVTPTHGVRTERDLDSGQAISIRVMAHTGGRPRFECDCGTYDEAIEICQALNAAEPRDTSTLTPGGSGGTTARVREGIIGSL